MLLKKIVYIEILKKIFFLNSKKVHTAAILILKKWGPLDQTAKDF